MNMKKNAAIYARVSSAKQKEDENIQSQISALSDYANKSGFCIPNGWVFMDEGYSGSNLNRPALDSLRETIVEGVIDTILVYSPDRLSRKYAYQLLLEMEFQKQGVDLIFLNTPRANNPEEQLSLHFKGIFAEYERIQIAERCRRGRLYRAKQGSVSVISRPPFGYDYIKKSSTTLPQYVINNDSANVRKIFNLYTKEHISLAKICHTLQQEGVLSPKGKKDWCKSTVRDILKNEAYIGTAHYGKTEAAEGVKGRMYRTTKGEKRTTALSATKSRPKELWIPITVPQIILESDFEVAKIKLEENRKTASRNTKAPSILQGLLTCGYCSGAYYKKTRDSRKYYSCSNRLKGSKCNAPSLKQDDLDSLVWDHVIELLNNPFLIEEEIKRRDSENLDNKGVEAKQKELDKDILRLSNAKDKLLDAYQDGNCLTLEDLKERLKAIDLKQKAAKREKTSLLEFATNEKKVRDLKNHMSRFQEQLNKSKELSVTDKQNVLRLLLNEVVITGDQVEIKHCIPCYNENSAQNGPLRCVGQL